LKTRHFDLVDPYFLKARVHYEARAVWTAMNGWDAVRKTARAYRAAYNVLFRRQSGIEWDACKLGFVCLARRYQQNGERPARMNSHVIAYSWRRLAQGIDHMDFVYTQLNKA
jgi:hypothetical protein